MKDINDFMANHTESIKQSENERENEGTYLLDCTSEPYFINRSSKEEKLLAKKLRLKLADGCFKQIHQNEGQTKDKRE